MAQGDGPLDGDQGVPGKQRIVLRKLIAPQGTVQTAIGKLYLYGLRLQDLNELEKLPEAQPIERLREFLPHVASLTETKGLEKRQPLTRQDIGRLSDVDIEVIAESYCALLLRSIIDADIAAKPQRQPGENVPTYLNRLLKHEVEASAARGLKIRDLTPASTSIFDTVRRSLSGLSSTISAAEQLAKFATPVEIHTPRVDLSAITDHAARRAQERAEELEMVRLTSTMTAESATALKDLVEAAATLLQQADERDKKSDISSRKQIRVAVWSVGITAAAALAALILSGMAYVQDKTSNESGDKWQSELLTMMRDGNAERSATEEEVRRLRDQIEALEAEIARVETSQAAALPKKITPSAPHRVINPGKLPLR